MKTLARALVRVFVALVVALGVLFVVYDYQTIRALVRQRQHEEVESASRKLQRFSQDVSRTLEKHAFKDLLSRTRGEFLDFERLSRSLLEQGEHVTYVHWKDEKGETFLFKGPRTLQQIVVNAQGVSYQLREGSEVKEIRVERPTGGIEKITEVAAPIVAGRRIGTVTVGLATDEIARKAEEAAFELRTRTVLYSGIALTILGGTMLYVRRLMVRVSTLQSRFVEHSRMAYVGELASGLVHEIRNPLNGIGLNMALLEEEIDEAADGQRDAFKKLLARIRPSLDHLERLSTEFLLFARPPRLTPEPTDVDALVHQTAEFLQAQCDRAGVRLVTELAGSSLDVELDRQKVRQVIVNLVANALDATPAGGTITLRTRPAPDLQGVQIEVADTGSGIPTDHLARAFELFHSTKPHGVGLGLAICKRLVEDHGGSIGLSSPRGQGTTATLRLPRRTPARDLGAQEVEGDDARAP